MHAVIRKYTASPDVVTEARPKLQHLEQTMRGTPGFVAYFVIDAGEGVAASVSVFDDRKGAEESTHRAAEWVKRTLTDIVRGAPEITAGEVTVHAGK